MLRKLCLFVVFFKSALLFSQTPVWHWAREANSSGQEFAWDVATDINNGDVYIAGRFDNNLSAKYGAAFSSSYGQLDGFIAKYNSVGGFLWAIKIGGTDDEEIKSISVDPSGNVYVAGYFKSVADFDPSAASFNLTPTSGAGNADGFLAKYSSTGSFIWAVKFGGTQADDVWRLYADANNVYIAGQYMSVATFSSTNAVTKTTAAALGQVEFFGAKYDQSGVAQWVVSGGSVKNEAAQDVKADATGVYFTGYFEHNLNIYNAAGALASSLNIVSPNKPDAFIIKYSQAGTFAWATSAASSDDDYGYGIAQDVNNVYITGSYKNNTIGFPGNSPIFTKTNQGGTDIFLAAISKSTGIYQWASSQTGSAGGDEAAYELESDNANNLVLTGYFKSNLNYSAYGGPNLSTTGGEDIFVSSFNNTGNFLWSLSAGAGGIDIAYGLATHTTGAIYVAGEHAGPAAFGSNVLTAGGGKNIFVAKTGCELILNNTTTASQTICTGNAPSSLTGALPTGGIGTYSYTWQQSLNSTTWTAAIGTNTTQNYSPPSLTTTTYYRRLVSAGGSCISSQSNTLQITVTPLPTTASAGSNQTICATTYTLNANAPTIGTGSWSVFSGTGTITTLSNPTSPVNGISVGTNKFVWSISNGACPASTSTVTITRDNFPSISNAGSNQTICATAFTLNANAPVIGNGSWLVSSGTGTVTALSNPSSQVNGLSVGQNNLVWTISNGVCPASSTTLTVTRDNVPTVSNAGSSQTICATTYTLNANSPAIGTGSWSVFSGTGTVTTISNPASSVNGISVGLNKFVWSITNGVCPVSTSTVTISRDNFPSVSNAGSNQTICATSFTLNANNPAIGNGSWLVSSGTGTVVTLSNPSSPVNGVSVGQNNFVWSISNGVCPLSTSTITVSRDDYPTVSNAGISQTLCPTSTTLNANAPVVGVGTWSVTIGSANIVSVNNPNSVANSLSIGSNVFTWVISNGVCPSSSSTVAIVKDQSPSNSVAGINQNLCTSTSLLNGNIPSVGQGQWLVISGNSTVTSINTPTSTVSGLSIGQNAFVWVISYGVCPSTSDTIIIFRDQLPTTSIAGSDQTICATAVSLNGNMPIIGAGSWSVLSGAGTLVNPSVANTNINGISVGQNQFAWTISNGSCPPSTSTVSITRNDFPTISNAGADQTICATATTISANTPLVGIGLWSSVGTGTIGSTTNPYSTVNGLSVGQNNLVWTISNGVCPSSSSTVTINRDQEPSIALAGSDKTICGANTALNANVPTIGSGTWNFISGNGTFNNASDPSSAISNLNTGANVITWSISNGVCASSVDTVIISSDALPTIANAGNDKTICSEIIDLEANIPLVGTALWTSVSGNGNVLNTNQNNSLVNNIGVGANIFRWTISNGICPASADEIIITRDLPPDAAIACSDIETENPVAELTAITPSVGSGSWSVISGDVEFVDPSKANTSVNNLSIGDNVVRWTTRNGVCPENSDDVLIYLKPLKIPNGFSPNGDGFNDAYVIPSIEFYPNVKFNVFNRWGGLVYESNNYKNDWKGTNLSNEKLSDDTYYYVIEINKKLNYTGFIVLKQNK